MRLSLVHVHACPPDPSSFRALPSLSPSLCPPSVARVGIHLSAITGLDDNAAISGRPSFARPPSVRVRRFYCNENERGVCGPDDVRPDPIPFPPSPPGKRVLIWCPRPRRPCPSAGPVGPAKKFQKTNGTHHLNKWFFCLKLNRRNDRPRPNPTEENERGTQRSGAADRRFVFCRQRDADVRSLARGGSGGGRDEKRPSRGSRARRARVHSRSLARLAVILPPLHPVASLHRLRRTTQCP